MSEKSTFRPDLEGLRAVAVALVLLYHARVPGITGGYVGVDVFFVLSGFLITGLLVRELAGTGRVDFAGFYARRARRLLPASALTLVVTILASAFLLPPVQMPDVAGDTVAAGLYVSNIRFALQATDYLGSQLAPSPVLHFWSLGVEEQFYLFWPALLALTCGVLFRAGRREDGLRRVGIVLAVVFVASLALEVWLTGVSQPWAFFSLPTRAWELALGGLLALPAAARLVPRRAGPWLGWTGLAMIVAAGFILDDVTPFPGVAVLLPTMGSALVIASGLARRGGAGATNDVAESPATSGLARFRVPAALLSLPPMRYLGRISYSLYLWHWPILVLPAAYLGHEIVLAGRLGLVAIAVVVAAASQRFVEDPIRHGRFIGFASRRSLAMVGVLSLTVAVAAVSANALATVRLDASGPTVGGSTSDVPLPTRTPAPSAAPPTSTPAPAASTAPGASSSSPASAQPAPSAALPPPPGGSVPADLVPSLAAAANDLPAIYANNCHLDVPTIALPGCVYGSRSSSTTVVLFGDSHAAQWFPALLRLATQHGWRLEPMTKSGCTPASVPVWSGILDRAYTECDQWRAAVLSRIAAEHPALVVVSTSRAYELTVGGRPVASSTRTDLWSKGLATTLTALKGSAANVVLIGDTPRSVDNPPACLSQHMNDATACATPYADAVDEGELAREAAAAAQSGTAFVDPTAWICRTDPCPAIFGRFLIYRDQGHLTRTYAAGLAWQLDAQLPPLTP